MTRELTDILSNKALTTQERSDEVNKFLLKELKATKNIGDFLRRVRHSLSIMKGDYGSKISASSEVLMLIIHEFLGTNPSQTEAIADFLYILDKIGISFDEISKLQFKQESSKLDLEIKQKEEMLSLFTTRLPQEKDEGKILKLNKRIKYFEEELEELKKQKEQNKIDDSKKLALAAFKKLAKLTLVKKGQLNMAINFLLHAQNLGIFNDIDQDRKEIENILLKIIESIISSPYVFNKEFPVHPIAQIIIYARDVLKLDLQKIYGFSDFEDQLAQKLRKEQQKYTISNIQDDVFRKIIKYLAQKSEGEHEWQFNFQAVEDDPTTFILDDCVKVKLEDGYGPIGKGDNLVYVRSTDISVTDIRTGQVIARAEIDGPSHDSVVDHIPVSPNSRTQARNSLLEASGGKFFCFPGFEFDLIRSFSEPELFQYFDKKGLEGLREHIAQYFKSLKDAPRKGGVAEIELESRPTGAAAASQGEDLIAITTPPDMRDAASQLEQELRAQEEREQQRLKRKQTIASLEQGSIDLNKATLIQIRDRFFAAIQQEEINIELINDLLIEYERIFNFLNKKEIKGIKDLKDCKIDEKGKGKDKQKTPLDYVISAYLIHKSQNADEKFLQRYLDLISTLFIQGFDFDKESVKTSQDEVLLTILAMQDVKRKAPSKVKRKGAKRLGSAAATIELTLKEAQKQLQKLITNQNLSPDLLIGKLINIINNTRKHNQEQDRIVSEIINRLERAGKYSEMFKIVKYCLDQGISPKRKHKEHIVPIIATFVMSDEKHQFISDAFDIFGINFINSIFIEKQKYDLERSLIYAIVRGAFRNAELLVGRGVDPFSPILTEDGRSRRSPFVRLLIQKDYNTAIKILELKAGDTFGHEIGRGVLTSIFIMILEEQDQKAIDIAIKSISCSTDEEAFIAFFSAFQQLVDKNQGSNLNLECLEEICRMINNKYPIDRLENFHDFVTSDNKYSYPVAMFINRKINISDNTHNIALFCMKSSLFYLIKLDGIIKSTQNLEEKRATSERFDIVKDMLKSMVHKYLLYVLSESKPIDREVMLVMSEMYERFYSHDSPDYSPGSAIEESGYDTGAGDLPLEEVVERVEDLELKHRDQTETPPEQEPLAFFHNPDGSLNLLATMALMVVRQKLDPERLRTVLDNIRLTSEILPSRVPGRFADGLNQELIKFMIEYGETRSLNSLEYSLVLCQVLVSSLDIIAKDIESKDTRTEEEELRLKSCRKILKDYRDIQKILSSEQSSVEVGSQDLSKHIENLRQLQSLDHDQPGQEVAGASAARADALAIENTQPYLY